MPCIHHYNITLNNFTKQKNVLCFTYLSLPLPYESLDIFICLCFMRQCVINIGEIKQFKKQSYHSRRWTNLLDSTSMFSSVTPHSSLARAAAVGGVSLSAPLIRAVYCLRARFIHILCVSLTHSPH